MLRYRSDEIENEMSVVEIAGREWWSPAQVNQLPPSRRRIAANDFQRIGFLPYRSVKSSSDMG